MKMNTKFSLALIALVGIGVFALPSTVALFSGQHSFYNIDATGNQVPCTKCHGDVKAELSSSGFSATTGTHGPHANFRCEYCHRAEAGYATGDDAVVKITYSNVTGPATTTSATLVTTIQNFETGNFPKQITGTGSAMGGSGAGINWSTYSPKNLDLTDFSEQTDYQVSGKYYGQISSTQSGIVYNVSRYSEAATYNGSTGKPLDTNTSTQGNAVNPTLITLSGASGSTLNFTGAGSREVTPGTRYHAASLVSCLECHGGEQEKGVAGYEIESAEPYMHSGWLLDATDPNASNCWNCHYSNDVHGAGEGALAAGGFQNPVTGKGLTTGSAEEGAVEAHNAWVTTNDNISRFGYGASNDACVACHTHVAVEISFQKGYLLQFNATEEATGNYTVSNFNVQGTVNVTTYGNESGNTFAVGNSTYGWTPVNGTLYINGTATQIQVIGLNGTATSDSNESLQGQ